MAKNKKDDDELSDFDDLESKRDEAVEEESDDEYAGEWGWTLVKALRGRTAGRRLKRNLCKYGFTQFVCGFTLSVLCVLEFNYYEGLNFFFDAKYGSSLQSLMWVVSLPSFVCGIFTLLCVRYWASFTTNRDLLASFFQTLYFGFLCLIINNDLVVSSSYSYFSISDKLGDKCYFGIN